MNILWLTNVVIPEASILWNEKPTPFGGWLVHASKMLSTKEGMELSVLFPKPHINRLTQVKGERITYYGFPSTATSDDELNAYLTEALNSIKPDIVHIYGTEYKHSYQMIKLCNEKGINLVTSIQGLVSVYADHYGAFLPPKVLLRHTFRDFIKNENIMKQQEQYRKRGYYELKAIQNSKHIIGRTSWDYACVKQMNPDAIYHFCNETLRMSFYHNEWSLASCEKYSIFASQGYYPIKGLHMLIEAFKLVSKAYPEAKLYISGENVFSKTGRLGFLKQSSYSKYINDLIKSNHLEDKIHFVGILDEDGMINQFMKAHVFVLPSAIENSPNSIGEAMMLGVPTIASYVGGVMNLVHHEKDGFLYQFDAPYMLAHYINELFSHDDLALKVSKEAKLTARDIHNPETNLNQLVSIYQDILNH